MALDEIAKKGACYACRSASKTEPVLQEIRELTKREQSAVFWELDLSSLASVRSFANACWLQQPLHLLINNADFAGSAPVTADGFETHFQVNSLTTQRSHRSCWIILDHSNDDFMYQLNITGCLNITRQSIDMLAREMSSLKWMVLEIVRAYGFHEILAKASDELLNEIPSVFSRKLSLQALRSNKQGDRFIKSTRGLNNSAIGLLQRRMRLFYQPKIVSKRERHINSQVAS